MVDVYYSGLPVHKCMSVNDTVGFYWVGLLMYGLFWEPLNPSWCNCIERLPGPSGVCVCPVPKESYVVMLAQSRDLWGIEVLVAEREGGELA